MTTWAAAPTDIAHFELCIKLLYLCLCTLRTFSKPTPTRVEVAQSPGKNSRITYLRGFVEKTGYTREKGRKLPVEAEGTLAGLAAGGGAEHGWPSRGRRSWSRSRSRSLRCRMTDLAAVRAALGSGLNLRAARIFPPEIKQRARASKRHLWCGCWSAAASGMAM